MKDLMNACRDATGMGKMSGMGDVVDGRGEGVGYVVLQTAITAVLFDRKHRINAKGMSGVILQGGRGNR